MKKLFATLLAAALVSLLCSACGSSKAPTNSAPDPNTEVSVLDENEYSSELQTFIAAVNKGNYLDAIDEYNENIYGNSLMENEASVFLQDLLFGTLDKYNQGICSETDFNNAYATVKKVDDALGIVTFAVTDAQEQFTILEDSKSNYQNGVEYMSSSDYLSAADSFSLVSTLDVNYEDAQANYTEAMDSYIQQVIDAAEGKIASGEYDTAIGIIDTAEYSTGWYSEYDDLRTKAYTMAAEESVNNAIDAGDYPAAKAAYESYVDNAYVTFSVDTISNLETAKTDYRNSIKDSARQSADESNYADAMNTIESGLAVLVDDIELLQLQTDMQAEYEDYLLRTTPVSLADLSWYKKDGGSISSVGSNSDIMGNNYSNVLASSGDGSVTYRIDGIYKNFSGYFYVKSTSKSSYGERAVSIWGDGVELFSESIDGGEEPTYFSIDVSGVKDLTIKMYTPTWSMNGTYLGDPILTP